MTRILVFLICLLSFHVGHSQDKPVPQDQPVNQNIPKNLDPNFQDSLDLNPRTRRSTSNRNIKNLDAKIQDYKIITRENDTTFLDTTLSVQKDYKFNYLRRDKFDLIQFSNIGQSYNSLSLDLSSNELLPKFGARGRHFNYMEIDDINYYYVPTPLTELMYKTAFEQGQLLDAFFTVNTSRQLNFSVAYKGLRSLGKYQHILTSTGNFRFTTNYKTKNDRYHFRGHVVFQDLSNEENGGLRDADLINFESGNPEFIDRSVFDPRFENSESILDGKRFHLEQAYSLIRKKDSINSQSLKIGNVLSFTEKYYEYTQSSQNDFFGDAFETAIKEKTQLEDFYAEANARYENNRLGTLGFRAAYHNYNYGYDKLVQIEGETITNRIKDEAISVGASYENSFGKLKLEGDAAIIVSGDFDNNYIQASASYVLNEDIEVGAGLNLSTSSPQYNQLLYQSDYINYNWQSDSFKSVKSNQIRFMLKSEKFVDVEVDYTTIDNYTYFADTDPDSSSIVVRPIQTPKSINYFRLKLGKKFSHGKFHLMNTFRYQAVGSGEGVINIPEFITRNTLYFADHLFKKALYIETGVTLKYFSNYFMNGYDPVLAEFYVQSDQKLGGFPMLDFFINAKVRQTRIYLKAEHFNSAWTGYDFYSAPNYPYRDFNVRFGLVWNFFL